MTHAFAGAAAVFFALHVFLFASWGIEVNALISLGLLCVVGGSVSQGNGR